MNPSAQSATKTLGDHRLQNLFIYCSKKVKEEDTWHDLGPDTIANNTLGLMEKAGIPKRFKSHSLRAAACTYLVEKGVQRSEIMLLGRWNSERTMNRYYDKRQWKGADPSQLFTTFK